MWPYHKLRVVEMWKHYIFIQVFVWEIIQNFQMFRYQDIFQDRDFY